MVKTNKLNNYVVELEKPIYEVKAKNKREAIKIIGKEFPRLKLENISRNYNTRIKCDLFPKNKKGICGLRKK